MLRYIKNKINKTLSNYIFILKTIWKSTPVYLIILAVLTILESVLPLLPMILAKDILNLLAKPEKTDDTVTRVFLLIGASAAAYIVMRIISVVKGLISALMLNIVGKNVTYMIQKKAAELDLKFYDTPDYYKKLENARRALNRNWQFLLGAPIDIFGKSITLVTMVGVLASFNVWLVPVIIAGVTPNIIVQVKTRKKEMEFYTNQIPETRKIAYTESILSDRNFAKEIRIFDLGKYFIDISQKLYREQYKKIKALKLWSMRVNIVWDIISIISLFGCQAYIAFKAIWGKVTLGDWSFYTAAAHSIQETMAAIFTIFAMSYEEDLYTDILKEFINTEPEIYSNHGKDYPDIGKPPLIEFRDVRFSYPGVDDCLLKGLNFTINPGERVALVGLNGAGKSTVIKLLTRLYEPTAGEILFNGIDIKEYKPVELYKMFGVVFQDFSQYAFTLKENITLSCLEKSHDTEALRRAVEASGVDKIEGKLPDGLETYITKNFDLSGCSNLSGGEWQKVAIARGFFRDVPIVVLDEPTASLDPEAEYDIYSHFVRLCTNKTAILISHRLSSVRMVDKILLLKNGTITEAGTHQDLIELKGDYARLFKLQAEQYKIPRSEAS